VDAKWSRVGRGSSGQHGCRSASSLNQHFGIGQLLPLVAAPTRQQLQHFMRRGSSEGTQLRCGAGAAQVREQLQNKNLGGNRGDRCRTIACAIMHRTTAGAIMRRNTAGAIMQRTTAGAKMDVKPQQVADRQPAAPGGLSAAVRRCGPVASGLSPQAVTLLASGHCTSTSLSLSLSDCITASETSRADIRCQGRDTEKEGV
jgi:hypothetical protein